VAEIRAIDTRELVEFADPRDADDDDDAHAYSTATCRERQGHENNARHVIDTHSNSRFDSHLPGHHSLRDRRETLLPVKGGTRIQPRPHHSPHCGPSLLELMKLNCDVASNISQALASGSRR